MEFSETFDVVISFDTTGSMYTCLENVKKNMKDMMRKLKRDIPGLYIGIIAHGDYDTAHTYVIKHEDLTDNVEKLCKFTEEAKCTKGGKTSKHTMDEAYELALHYSRKEMSWRNNSNRILVLIGDCRPHEKDFQMNEKHIDWNNEIYYLREMGVKIYAVQCMGRSKSDQFYHKIASYTFGHRVTLHDFNRIGEVLVSICRREAELDETPEHVFKTLNARSDASCDITAEKEQNFKADNVPGRLALQNAHQPYLLSDYGIKQHESLTLIVPLFCIPEDLDCVVFDLSWEFPKKNPDFLDASCLAFENRDFLQVIDWNHPENDFYLKGAIKHTHEITYGGQEGHQTINVSLKALPTYVSGLYFVLSSWKSPNLSAFSNPSLKFYPESQPENNLCKTTFTHALNSQAVIMCSVVRQNERWLIFDSDEDCCVNGNSKMYNPIRKQIEKLIAKDE